VEKAILPIRILLAANEGGGLYDFLHALHFDLERAATVVQARTLLTAKDFGLVMVDLRPEDRASDWAVICSDAAPVPVALVTRDQNERANAAELGYTICLLRPFSAQELVNELRRFTFRHEVPPTTLATVHRYFEVLNRKDWNALAAMVTPDVHYSVPGDDPYFSTEVRGREEFKAFSAQVFRAFADAHFEVRHVFAHPNSVVARYETHFTSAVGGVVESQGSVLFQFSGPLISRISSRVDTSRLWTPS
jgi:ketosteroid isomerase-like protein